MVVLQIKVKLAGVKNSPPCERCVKAEADCLRKATGPGCKRCAERKAGCSLVGLWRKMEKKAERVEERRRMLSEPEADNIPLSLELVELVSQIATNMDLMERLVMGVDRIGKGLEMLTERLGEKKEEKKKRKDTGMQTEEMSESEGSSQSTSCADSDELPSLFSSLYQTPWVWQELIPEPMMIPQ